MSKPIQEQFGDKVIEVFADFARMDLPQPADLEKDAFSHISDVRLRRALSNVFYGARWIYKLGLALLTRNEERAAHIRAQIVDYAAVCEAILSYCVGHAIRKGHTVGDTHCWKDPEHKSQPLRWSPSGSDSLLRLQNLWWLIKVGQACRIIDAKLAQDLNWLRGERNAVHIRERVALGEAAYLNESRKAFELVIRTIDQTKRWKATHS
jgi:hypothetical protein